MPIDEMALRDRLARMTMNEANIAGDFDGQLLVDAYADASFTFANEEAWGDLDDALRVVVALRPFGEETLLAYRWAAESNDDPISLLVFQIQDTFTGFDPSHGRYAEMSVYALARSFPGGDVVDAVVFAAKAAEQALVAAGHL